MKKFLIFIGGFILGGYAMHTHIMARAAKSIIEENKNKETKND